MASAPQAEADAAADYCRQHGTDDVLRPIPQSLLPIVTRLFQLGNMPAKWVLETTYFRCADGAVLVCTVGANLPCGKADTRRSLPAADAWCTAHRGSDFIPMAVTGHDTIYRWRCDGAKAAAEGPALAVDERGFIAQLWKRAE
ncbi:MAG TPA: hypothetical protein VFA12_11660 [Stellaceae bacterium]|nr:hypothetical protein [Stellaceae bacterium]